MTEVEFFEFVIKILQEFLKDMSAGEKKGRKEVLTTVFAEEMNFGENGWKIKKKKKKNEHTHTHTHVTCWIHMSRAAARLFRFSD